MYEKGQQTATRSPLQTVLVAAVIILKALPFIYSQQIFASMSGKKPDRVRPMHQSLEIGTVIDAFFGREMARQHIPGAVIVIVEGDDLVFKKGYGYSDLASRTPADPDRSRFRVGSVSKLFTATAVMQLVDDGRIDLNTDINQYLLDFSIPNPFENPLTPAHLLTHTSGFDNQMSGRYARSAPEVRPLSTYLRENMPELRFPPGESLNYGNYNISLLGHLVEAVTLQSFEAYMNQRVFTPLGMTASSFAQPEAEDPDLVRGYTYNQKGYHAVPVAYPNQVPAGGLIATGSDIANFIMAQLHAGRFKTHRLLSEKALAEMQTQQVSLHPRIPGWCYGFYEKYIHGHRVLMHSGGTRGFSSLLFLLPEDKLGFFLVYNMNRAKLQGDFVSHFLAYYYPPPNEAADVPEPPRPPSSLARFTGKYDLDTLPGTTFEKSYRLTRSQNEAEVTTTADGSLKLDLAGKSYRLHQIEPLLFKNGGDDYVAFKENQSGRIAEMYVNFDKPKSLKKMSWLDTLSVQLNLYRLFNAVFAAACALALPFLLYLRKRGASIKNRKQVVRIQTLAAATCLVYLIFMRGITDMTDPETLKFGISGELLAWLSLPLVAVTLTILTSYLLLTNWKNVPNLLRCYFACLTLSCLACVPYLYYWNLLGFKL